MMAEDRCGWAPGWTDKIARSDFEQRSWPRRGAGQGCPQ